MFPSLTSQPPRLFSTTTRVEEGEAQSWRGGAVGLTGAAMQPPAGGSQASQRVFTFTQDRLRTTTLHTRPCTVLM